MDCLTRKDGTRATVEDMLKDVELIKKGQAPEHLNIGITKTQIHQLK